MPDSSKLSSEEYAQKVSDMVTGKRPLIDPGQYAEPTASERSQFKPGQTVWYKVSGRKLDFVHSHGGLAWVQESDYTHNFVSVHSLTATDPSQPVEPKLQACPFCGCSARLMEGIVIRVECDRMGECFFHGPSRPTMREAIAAWNSLRVK